MYISCFIVFANELLLAVYFICTLDYRNDGRQKENLSNFLIQVQNESQSSRGNSLRQQHIRPRTANKHPVHSGGSRSFAKETRALKMRSTVAGHWRLTTTKREDQ